MSTSKENKNTLYRYKKYIIELLLTLKKNRETLIYEFNNEALHDFRVVLRKLLSINTLSAKTLGFCFDSRLKLKLKTLLKKSSGLRDIEELLVFAPNMLNALAEKREAYKRELISIIESNLEVEILCSYVGVYQTLLLRQANLQEFKEAALEATIESLNKTSKRFTKITKVENINFDELHFVRKRFKGYRYQFDFLFLGANEGSIVCKRVQDKLGKVNDLRIWIEILATNGVNVEHKLQIKLNEALKDARKEALIFESQEYSDSLAVELRRRMAIC